MDEQCDATQRAGLVERVNTFRKIEQKQTEEKAMRKRTDMRELSGVELKDVSGPLISLGSPTGLLNISEAEACRQ
jgi:hypothetical protein